MAETTIAWTDTTWNPTTGCTKISPGCLNCYIERTPPFRMKGRKFAGGKIPLELHADRLEAPLHWRKPRRVFVNSMSDLFHEDVPDEFIGYVFKTMGACEDAGLGHVFQILTKRPERMLSLMTSGILYKAWNARRMAMEAWPPRNVWLGVSVENRAVISRIDILRDVPAALRFLSIEPLLEDLGKVDLRGVGWVIVGGESGHKARPFDIEWARSIRDQCKAAGVAFFMKQMGSKAVDCRGRYQPDNWPWPRVEGTDPYCMERLKLKDRAGADPAEWPLDLRVQQFPHTEQEAP